MLAIVVLQHGHWRDTVACLQSIAGAVASDAVRVIVVDNASTDDSVARLHDWIAGELPAAPRPVHDTVASHWWPLSGAHGQWTVTGAVTAGALPHWSLVPLAANTGFAAGMNAGIRLALRDAAVDAVWLLNNDTVTSVDAVTAVRSALDASPSTVGQFGTTVCYYDRPTIVQSVGWCEWNAWLATSDRVHDGANIGQPLARLTRWPGYVYGASWVLRSTALRAVGLLSEDGFLYGEELDWSCRARRDWGAALIAEAVVWHREGGTIGAGVSRPQTRSELADLCGISARLRLTRRFFPERLPTVYSSLLGAVFNRLRRGDPQRAVAVARLVLAGGLPAPRPGHSPVSHMSDPP